MKTWYAKNRERVLEQKRLQRLADPERFRARDRMYAKLYPERYREKSRRQYAEKRAIRLAAKALEPPRHNESAFDTITEDSAYWIGFLMGDGCIHQFDVRLQLGLTDSEHVQKYAEFIGLSRDPHVNKRYSAVSIKSPHLVEVLGTFGVVPRKSMIAKALGGIDSNRHFWRGLIDANGSIIFPSRTPNYPILSLVGARSIIEQFQRYCSTVLGGRIQTIHRHKSIWSLALGGSYAVPVISNLYCDCTTYLDRKMVRAKKAMQFQRRHNSGGPSNYQRTATAK